MDVVDAIAAVETDRDDKPQKDVVIESIEIKNAVSGVLQQAKAVLERVTPLKHDCGAVVWCRLLRDSDPQGRGKRHGGCFPVNALRPVLRAVDTPEGRLLLCSGRCARETAAGVPAVSAVSVSR